MVLAPMMYIFLSVWPLMNGTYALSMQDDAEDMGKATAWQIPDIDISNLELHKSLGDPMHRALEIIKNVETLPSCVKVATSALMHSCSALEGSAEQEETGLARGMDLFVDEEVNIYAIRLAICELSGAGVKIPRQCTNFAPRGNSMKKSSVRGFWTTDRNKKTKSPHEHYDTIYIGDIKLCSNALSSTNQLWTSFSNNKQNAVVLCRGMRSEIEKDQQIHLARILSGVSARAAESLHEARERYEEMKTSFEKVVDMIPSFHQAVAVNREQQVRAQLFWNEIHAQYDQTINAARELNRHIKDTVDGMQNINSTTNYVSAKLQKLVSNLDITAEKYASDISGIASETQDLANMLQAVQNDVRVKLIHDLHIAGREVAQYSTEMGSFSEQVTQLLQHINNRITDSEKDFAVLAGRQYELHEEMLRRWLYLQNVSESIHTTLQTTLPMAQQLSTIAGTLTVWMALVQERMESALWFVALTALLYAIVTRKQSLKQKCLNLATVAIIATAWGSWATILSSMREVRNPDATIFSRAMDSVAHWMTNVYRFDHRTSINLRDAAIFAAVIGMVVYGIPLAIQQRILRSKTNQRVKQAVTPALSAQEFVNDKLEAGKFRLPVNNPVYLASRLPNSRIAPGRNFELEDPDISYPILKV